MSKRMKNKFFTCFILSAVEGFCIKTIAQHITISSKQ